MFALLAAVLMQTAPIAIPPGERAVDPYVQSNANVGAAPLADGGKTFRAFHGRGGVQRVADAFVERNFVDPRVKGVFVDADKARLKRTLGEQICYLLDGGCAYTGRDMTASHRGMGLQATDFNAIVENLQASMDAEHVPFAAQNRLLAKLAPMERPIVERKDPQALKQWSRRLKAMLPASN